MADAVIVSTARTPIGKAFRGAFNDTHAADMGAHVIKHAAERAKVELGEIEDVILGCAAPEGTQGSNMARVAAMRAGAPVSVSGVTVNRFCSSGLQTIAMAAQRVLVDKVPVMLAGGLESVSLIQSPPGGNKHRLVNPWVQEHVPGIYHSMIQTADTVAERYKISRQAQDEYSLQSQMRTAAGQQAGDRRQHQHPGEHRSDEDRLVGAPEAPDRPLLHGRRRPVDDGRAHRQHR